MERKLLSSHIHTPVDSTGILNASRSEQWQSKLKRRMREKDAEKSKLEMPDTLRMRLHVVCRHPSLLFSRCRPPHKSLRTGMIAARFSINYLSSPRQTNGKPSVGWLNPGELFYFFLFSTISKCQNLFIGCFTLKWIPAATTTFCFSIEDGLTNNFVAHDNLALWLNFPSWI